MIIPPECRDSGASEYGRAIYDHLVSAEPLHELLPEALLAEDSIDHDRVAQLWGILDAFQRHKVGEVKSVELEASVQDFGHQFLSSLGHHNEY